MATRTSHTVLARITSHGSGGRAEIWVGHSVLTDSFTDPALTSKYFLRHPLYSFVVVKIVLSGKRRLIQNVRRDEEAASASDFKKVYKEQLEREAAEFDRKIGGTSSVYKGRSVRRETPEEPNWLDENPLDPPLSTPEPEVVMEVDSEWKDKVYVSKSDRKVFETVRNIAAKRHVAIMMIGPSGYGKTSVPQQMAKEWDMEFLRWDCATVRDPEEFFGFRGAQDGSTMDDDGETIFSKSNFTEVIENGNAVVVLDELNRIDPYISNILFPLLDHAGKTSIVGYDIEVGPNTIFVATVNIGYQFTGTFTLDTALTNRFTAKVLVGPLPKDIETKILMARGEISYAQAESVVDLMKGLRALNDSGELSIDASTRVSIQISEMVGAGLTIKEALQYVVVNGTSEDEAKKILDRVGYVLA